MNTGRSTISITVPGARARMAALMGSVALCAAASATAADGVEGVAVQAMQAQLARPASGARAEDRDVQPMLGVELQRVNPAVDEPNGSTARLYRLDRSPQAESSPELRTRLWVANRYGGLGAGADWAAAPAGSTLRPLRPVLGLRAEVSTQTRFIYEVRGPASSLANGVPGATDPEMRMALEFKSAPSAARNFRNGLFRVQLSNSSALTLRPRSGGMVVSYRSQF